MSVLMVSVQLAVDIVKNVLFTDEYTFTVICRSHGVEKLQRAPYCCWPEESTEVDH